MAPSLPRRPIPLRTGRGQPRGGWHGARVAGGERAGQEGGPGESALPRGRRLVDEHLLDVQAFLPAKVTTAVDTELLAGTPDPAEARQPDLAVQLLAHRAAEIVILPVAMDDQAVGQVDVHTWVGSQGLGSGATAWSCHSLALCRHQGTLFTPRSTFSISS